MSGFNSPGTRVTAAQIILSTDYTLPGTLPVTPIPFDHINFDTGGYVLSASGLFTIPAGVTFAEISSQMFFAQNSVVGTLNLSIFKNGAAMSPAVTADNYRGTGTGSFLETVGQVTTGVVSVAVGDTFQVRVNLAGGQTGLIADSTHCWFSIKGFSH